MIALRRAGPASMLVTAALAGCAYHGTTERSEVPVPAGARWTWGNVPGGPTSGREPSRAAFSDSAAAELRREASAAMAARGYQQVSDSARADFVLLAGMKDRDGYGIVRPVAYEGLGGQVPPPVLHLDPAFTFVRCNDIPGGICGNGFGGEADPSAPVTLYAACRAPWEACVTAGLWRKDGRLAWRASYSMDTEALERATPAQIRHIAHDLFEELP